jgi:hypothetical protein
MQYPVVTGVAERRSNRSKYVDARTASAITGGLINPRTLRELALQGLIAGAVRVPDRSGSGYRYWFDRHAIANLVEDLTALPANSASVADFETDERPVVLRDRRGHTLLDGHLVG